jgi:hypothetical protein
MAGGQGANRHEGRSRLGGLPEAGNVAAAPLIPPSGGRQDGHVEGKPWEGAVGFGAGAEAETARAIGPPRAAMGLPMGNQATNRPRWARPPAQAAWGHAHARPGGWTGAGPREAHEH